MYLASVILFNYGFNSPSIRGQNIDKIEKCFATVLM